jgi:hypothetical protein
MLMSLLSMQIFAEKDCYNIASQYENINMVYIVFFVLHWWGMSLNVLQTSHTCQSLATVCSVLLWSVSGSGVILYKYYTEQNGFCLCFVYLQVDLSFHICICMCRNFLSS